MTLSDMQNQIAALHQQSTETAQEWRSELASIKELIQGLLAQKQPSPDHSTNNNPSSSSYVVLNQTNRDPEPTDFPDTTPFRLQPDLTIEAITVEDEGKADFMDVVLDDLDVVKKVNPKVAIIDECLSDAGLLEVLLNEQGVLGEAQSEPVSKSVYENAIGSNISCTQGVRQNAHEKLISYFLPPKPPDEYLNMVTLLNLNNKVQYDTCAENYMLELEVQVSFNSILYSEMLLAKAPVSSMPLMMRLTSIAPVQLHALESYKAHMINHGIKVLVNNESKYVGFGACKNNESNYMPLMVLQRILMGTDVVKNVNKNNALHVVLFEARALVMHLDAEKEMMSQCRALLGKFIFDREPNIRYLGFENMTRMLIVTDVQDIIKRHQAQIIFSLKDPDISIRRWSLDFLYGMCDVTNAKDIVEELSQYLSTAEFAMREELSLKAAILAEKFAPDLSWYVYVILQLIDKAGDFISDDIWFRVVQYVTNNGDLQPYAAFTAREFLNKPAVHETMVKVTAYMLGEHGHILAPNLSVSALDGRSTFSCMRIIGQYNKQKIFIHIDAGSTRNFLYLSVAKELDCSLEPIKPVKVSAAGHTMVSTHKCSTFGWNMQGYSFVTEVRTLPLDCCDFVLGVQRLITLGPILWEYVLRGVTKSHFKVIKGSRLNKLLLHSPQLSLLSIRDIQIDPVDDSFLPLSVKFNTLQWLLDLTVVKQKNAAATNVLVQWKDFPSEHATWEFYPRFLSKFPKFHPWGQGCSRQGSIVTGFAELGSSSILIC